MSNLCVWPLGGKVRLQGSSVYSKIACKWDFQNCGKMVLGLGCYDQDIGRRNDGFSGVHVGNETGKKTLRKYDCLSFAIKRSCAS